MKCPFCKCELVRGEDRRYETQFDHVTDPNEEYGPRPMRPTFICGCLLSQGAFWDEQGDYYCGNFRTYLDLKKQYGDRLDNGGLHAIDSWHWRFVRERRREEWLRKHIAPYRWYQDWRWRVVAKKFHPEWFAKKEA